MDVRTKDEISEKSLRGGVRKFLSDSKILKFQTKFLKQTVNEKQYF